MMLVKCFGIFFVIAHVSQGHKVRDNVGKFWDHLIEPFANECLEKTHPDQKDVAIMEYDGYVPSTKEMGCYVKCLYLNLNLVDSSGNINKEHILSLNTPGITSQLVDECLALTVDKDDECHKVYVFANCIDVNLSV